MEGSGSAEATPGDKGCIAGSKYGAELCLLDLSVVCEHPY